jgi:hypothetical protein
MRVFFEARFRELVKGNIILNPVAGLPIEVWRDMELVTTIKNGVIVVLMKLLQFIENYYHTYPPHTPTNTYSHQSIKKELIRPLGLLKNK